MNCLFISNVKLVFFFFFFTLNTYPLHYELDLKKKKGGHYNQNIFVVFGLENNNNKEKQIKKK